MSGDGIISCFIGLPAMIFSSSIVDLLKVARIAVFGTSVGTPS
jgi:hypothetical protein